MPPTHLGRIQSQVYSFLSLTLDGGEWLVLCPVRFTPRERNWSSHWKWGWVGSRAGMDILEKRKTFVLPPLQLHGMYSGK